ncbi:hypothetical protein [Spiroplasma endosymbiont of Polydrusus pterygomalis]|uniref:hypothetical protein n=1 Tax=Spiroplasma endosymbiont of Polydrusus pterygomalis TaxID=3139327 RepID=UPI003CCA983F
MKDIKVMVMKISVLKKYQKFINIFFIIFIGYILFKSFFSIINIADNYSFVNITLNLFYLVWTSFIFLFCMGILVNFKQMKKTTILSWKLILFSNWQTIILWLCNILLISYILFFSNTSIIYQLQNIIVYKAISYFLVILCYVFNYAIFTIGFITMLILFCLYIGYLKKINDVIPSSYYMFSKSTLTNIVFWQHHQLTISILAIICRNFKLNQWFIEIISIIDNLRKIELLTQFKKQTTPPNFIFN